MIVNIKSDRSLPADTCRMCKRLYDGLYLSERKNCKIILGRISANSFIIPETDSSAENNLYLAENLFKQLLFVDDVTMNIWRKDNDIYLGPVVGMLITEKDYKAMKKGRISTSIVEHVAQAGAHSNCLCYCFCHEGITLEEKCLKGVIFNKELNRWIERLLPIPDIIYDRALYEDYVERSDGNELFKQFVKNNSIQLINNKSRLGEYAVYKKQSTYEKIRRYLPETLQYRSFEDILYLLGKYGTVFIKSSLENKEKEVIAMSKNGDKCWLELHRGKARITFAGEMDKMKAFIEKSLEEKKSENGASIIVQQGIRPLKLENEELYLKVLIAKNEQGKWGVVNLHWDSKEKGTVAYESIYPNLKEAFEGIEVPSADELVTLCQSYARNIEREFGAFGELGIDIIVDESGKAWLMKCSPKPYKNPASGTENDELPKQAVTIFKYAEYLVMRKRKK